MARIILSIVAINGPRRRAGLAFGPVPVEIELDSLTEDQREQLKGDPMLAVVNAVDADDLGNAADKAAADKGDDAAKDSVKK